MRRHEAWRISYRNNRDLDHLTPEELSERLHDCINNARTRTERGKIGILSQDKPENMAWIVWATEVMEECNLRGYDYPGPINLAPHRGSFEHVFDPIPNMESVLAGGASDTRPYLLKFGDPTWLKRSFERGQFRIASASFYDLAAHNHARRDKELVRCLRLNPRNPSSRSLAASGSEIGSVASQGDYYLFCLATHFSARLFGDFASSACLLIRNTSDFLGRVAASLQAKLPKWRIQVGMVKYYDPVRIDPRQVMVPWFKPFKHAYQRELRVVCTPPNAVSRLDPIEIEIGSLENCATYIDKDTHPPVVLPPDPVDDPVRLFGAAKRDSFMIPSIPEAAKVQGIVLNRAGENRTDWFFELQYTEANGAWHKLKIPVREGLYLMSLLQAADKEQALSLLNPKTKHW